MSAKQITCIIIAMLAAILANAESKIDPDVLKSYAGTYKGKNVERAEVEFRFLFKRRGTLRTLCQGEALEAGSHQSIHFLPRVGFGQSNHYL